MSRSEQRHCDVSRQGNFIVMKKTNTIGSLGFIDQHYTQPIIELRSPKATTHHGREKNKSIHFLHHPPFPSPLVTYKEQQFREKSKLRRMGQPTPRFSTYAHTRTHCVAPQSTKKRRRKRPHTYKQRHKPKHMHDAASTRTFLT